MIFLLGCKLKIHPNAEEHDILKTKFTLSNSVFFGSFLMINFLTNMNYSDVAKVNKSE